METNKIVVNEDDSKKSSKIKKFFYNVFVKNIGYKALALGIAITLWILIVGLGF